MQRNIRSTSKTTRTTRMKLDESLPPKGDRVRKGGIDGAIYNGNAYVKKNGEWVLVKKNVNK